MTLFDGVGRRLWLAIALVAMVIVGLVFLLWPGRDGQDKAHLRSDHTLVTSAPSGTSSARSEPSDTSVLPGQEAEAAGEGLPTTRDHRALAAAAAKGIYTWDSRSSSYSDIYARVRSWWELLPDGSNPLSALVREFEGTGVTAGTFTELASQSARRIGTAQSLRCDLELAKVHEYPSPWEGLHVCTVTVNVVDETNSGTSVYSAPVTVILNCPPAPTAPSAHCAMVAFYATAERIVY